MHLAGSQRDGSVSSNGGHIAAHGRSHVERSCPRTVKAMAPGLENVSIRFALFRLVEEVSLRNDADELPGAIHNRQPAHPVVLEKTDGVLERRLWRSSDDPSRHHVTDCDHGSDPCNCKSSWLGSGCPLGLGLTAPTPHPSRFRSGPTNR